MTSAICLLNSLQTDVCDAETDSLLCVLLRLPSPAGSSTFEKDEPDSFGGGNE